MFFKEYFKSIADIIEAKNKGHITLGQNNADKGELCEIFVKDFLIQTIGDSFKISRGGKIVDHSGNLSKQLDVIISAKKSLKLFDDKGIYPTENVYGAISITSTLDKSKLLDCCDEFRSIPKENYKFQMEGYIIDEEYRQATLRNWQQIIPYKFVFAYSGEIKEDWINDILVRCENNIAKVPDLIIVNKIGYIEKEIFLNEENNLGFNLRFISFKDYKNYGVVFGKMLFHLNNLSHEELILKADLAPYFNKDLED